MRRTSRTGRNPTEVALAAVISLLTAVGFLLMGFWAEQPVFFFMTGSILLIGAAEVLGPRRAVLSRGAKWVGRIGMLIAILYILIALLPDD